MKVFTISLTCDSFTFSTVKLNQTRKRGLQVSGLMNKSYSNSETWSTRPRLPGNKDQENWVLIVVHAAQWHIHLYMNELREQHLSSFSTCSAFTVCKAASLVQPRVRGGVRLARAVVQAALLSLWPRRSILYYKCL